MANLFTDISEIKAFVPSLSDQIETGDFFPYIDDAAETYIEPYLSETYYDGLVTRYNASTTTAADDAILNHVRKASAWYGIYEAMPHINMRISNAGMVQHRNDETQQQRLWEYKTARQNSIRKADAALDRALKIMEANSGNYSDWTASSAYTVRTDLLITDADKFEKYGPKIGNSRRTYLKLTPYLDLVEQRYVMPILSDGFFETVKAAWKAGTTDADQDELLIKIYKAITWLGLYEGANDLIIDVSAEGIRVVSTNDGVTSAQHNEKAYENWRREILQNGKFYLASMQKYLDENASATKHATYYNNTDLYKRNQTEYNFPNNNNSNSSLIV